MGSLSPVPFERVEGRPGDHEGPKGNEVKEPAVDLLRFPPAACSSRTAACCGCGRSRRLGEHARLASAANSAPGKGVGALIVTVRGEPHTLQPLPSVAMGARGDCSELRHVASLTPGARGDCSGLWQVA